MLLTDIDISKKHADFTYRVTHDYHTTFTEQEAIPYLVTITKTTKAKKLVKRVDMHIYTYICIYIFFMI